MYSRQNRGVCESDEAPVAWSKPGASLLSGASDSQVRVTDQAGVNYSRR